MILKIKKTGRIVCKDLKIARSLVDRMFGLLIKSNPTSMLFNTRFGIHTFFLKEDIDVIVLDNKLNVVKIKQNLKPNRLFFWNPVYSCVIELPKGTISKFGLHTAQSLIIC